ncbi:MAG: plastocyanin/azurin family copper-binding protein [Bacteroidota bacterium]
MKSLYIFLISLFLIAASADATTHTIVNAGTSFVPATLTISLGDTVVYTLDPAHNVIEVEQTTWSNNGNTPKPGGFTLPFGGGTVIPASVGTYYYVCGPHASFGMKGMIIVELTSLSTGAITPTSLCKGSALSVPFTATGTFNGSNVFTAQLSNANGSFASPTNIGSLGGTSSGQISATIPLATPSGSAYRIRVVASSPSLIGTQNAQDLTVLAIPTASITPNGPTSFCEGLNVQLDAPTGAGLSYIWRLNTIVIGGAISPSYTASLPGLYSVEVSNGSCSATSPTQRVTVYPANPSTLTWTGNIDLDWSTVGNWDSPCAVPNAGDTVIINNGGPPPSLIPASVIGSMTINNTSGVTLGGDLQIAGSLTLATGSITLGSANLNLEPSASITGGSSTSFVITNGNGQLRQAGIGSGGRSGAVLFPVGSIAGSYTPLTLTNTGTTDQFSVAVKNNVLSNGTGGTALGSSVVAKTWFITESVNGGSNAGITFQWNASDELPSFNRSLCYVGHHDGAAWQPLQATGPAGGGDPYNRNATGVTAFSPFAIGDGASPLPVEYRSLSAQVRGEIVAIVWETEREINSRGFSVERSSSQTGKWTSLQFVESRGASRLPSTYEYLDHPPAAGVWYYRLKQVDMDGSQQYSSVLRADIGTVQRSLAIESAWPNPLRLSNSADAGVTFTNAEGGHAVLTIRNILGQLVALIYDGTVEAGGRTTARFNPAALSPGVYLYRLELGAQVAHHRIVVVK